MGLRETVERIAAMPRAPANEEAAKIRVLLPILTELGCARAGPPATVPPRPQPRCG